MNAHDRTAAMLSRQGALAHWLLVAAAALSIAASPQTPEAELQSFALADSELVVELVAAEPLVSSPVAMAWDARGRLCVVEMIDYPLGPMTGQVRLLYDDDGDGRYERASVLADGIRFPTGVFPWRDGFIVTSSAEILRLADRDDDGRADERRVLWTGFGEGNQQLRANGLTWGLDNWIYGANGRSDGAVRRPQDAAESAISLRARDFRFRPDGPFQAITGQSQFAQCRDDWGNRFISWNTIPIRHALLDDTVLSRNPRLAVEAVRSILDPGETGQIFPKSSTPQTFNAERTDYFNALAGLTIYRGDRLPSHYSGTVFVGETLRNLIHHRTLEPSVPSFVSRRAEAGKEFLASSDPWFHPVYLTTGPDGSLYVADFYRRWVEHPLFVADLKAREQTDWREGAEHGRIWRIRGKKASSAKPDGPAAMSTAHLVAALGDMNGWRRDTAQRLLVERSDRGARPALEELAEHGPVPLARVHALWTLEGLNSLDQKVLGGALGDPDCHVRQQALRLCDGRLKDSPDLLGQVVKLAGDDHAEVRYQLMIVLGGCEGGEKLCAVARVAAVDGGQPWFGMALGASVGKSAWSFLTTFLQQSPAALDRATAADTILLEQVGRLVAERGTNDEIQACWKLLNSKPNEPPRAGHLALSAGLTGGLADKNQSVRQTLAGSNGDAAGAERQLAVYSTAALRAALDANNQIDERERALGLLGRIGLPTAEARQLLALLAPDQAARLQVAAANSIGKLADAELAKDLFATWPSISILAQRSLAGATLRSTTLASALVEAIQKDALQPADVDPLVRDALCQSTNAAIAEQAKKLFASLATTDRQPVVAKYEHALKLTSDRQKGGARFKQHCLTCHALQGLGGSVGPDLSGVAARARESLLVDMLDPSRQISLDFRAYTLQTVDGKMLIGRIAAETPEAVTLRQADNAQVTVPRDQIDQLQATAKSLMPEGLEQQLSPQDVADLLDFLARPDRALVQ